MTTFILIMFMLITFAGENGKLWYCTKDIHMVKNRTKF